MSNTFICFVQGIKVHTTANLLVTVWEEFSGMRLDQAFSAAFESYSFYEHENDNHKEPQALYCPVIRQSILPPCLIKYHTIRDASQGTCPIMFPSLITLMAKESSELSSSLSQKK